MMKTGRSLGFTLVEVSASVALMTLAMALSLSGYIFVIKNVNQADVQNELDMDVQLAMESLKNDLRLSSLDAMFYHPAGAGPYTAISFPLAFDSDGDGILEKDAEGKIIWDQTVVYHIRPSTPNQLVKTVFSPRDDSLSDAQRQGQLEHVVKVGDGSGTFNGSKASSKIIFANLLEWEILPKSGRYDAYAPVLTRDRANMGYVLLDSGDHEFAFEVIGKNDKSSSYHVGIDQLYVSPSDSAREAEAQLPVVSESGATAFMEYLSTGSWKGNHHLRFPAGASGASFVLKIPNDRWEETNFSGLGYLADNTRVEFDESASPKDFIVRLDGMDVAWEASAQTGDPSGGEPEGSLSNMAVRILQKGADLADNGSWFSYDGEQCRLTFAAASNETLKVGNVYIGESASTTNESMDYAATTDAPVLAVTFSGNSSVEIAPGETVVSDWVDLPIDRHCNYLVSFHIANDPSKDGAYQWEDVRATDPTAPSALSTMVVEDAGSSIANDVTWSDRADIKPYYTNLVFGLKQIESSHPASGSYTSRIFDTRLKAPVYGDITWNAEVPVGSSLAFKVRTGDQPDLSDAQDWSAISSFDTPRSISASYKRYIQFQALLESDAEGQITPRLKDVSIEWESERQLVNVGGIFSKGPEFGIFEVSVDGQPIRSGLILDLEIYKDLQTMNRATRRVTSSLRAELTPRNSGL